MNEQGKTGTAPPYVRNMKEVPRGYYCSGWHKASGQDVTLRLCKPVLTRVNAPAVGVPAARMPALTTGCVGQDQARQARITGTEQHKV